jgi:hypothetical protein
MENEAKRFFDLKKWGRPTLEGGLLNRVME